MKSPESVAVGEQLDPQALMAAASQETGLEDWGDGQFVESLERYVQSLLTDLDLSPMGVVTVYMNLHRILVNWLRFQEDLKRHPEILDEELADPIVITGLPRTGTTKLQRMLAADPTTQRLSFWRCFNPAPLPGSKPGQADPRIAVTEQILAPLAQMFPELLAMHEHQAEEADEDVLLQEITLGSAAVGMRVGASSHLSWVLRDDRRQRMYEDERRLLQYLQWQDGGRRGRPWVLKSPAHLGNLETVLEIFPQATVVHCHRDPRVAIPSTLRLCELTRQAFTLTDFDVQRHGQWIAAYFAEETRRCLVQRDALGRGVRILDVPYEDIRQHGLDVVGDVYGMHGRAFTSEAKAAMASWSERHPQHRLGSYSYSLERYGLTEADVEHAFTEYFDRFGRLLIRS